MVRGGHDLAHSVLEELQSAVGRTGHFYDRNAIRFDAVQLDDLGAGQEESGRRRDDAAHGHHQQRRQDRQTLEVHRRVDRVWILDAFFIDVDAA